MTENDGPGGVAGREIVIQPLELPSRRSSGVDGDEVSVAPVKRVVALVSREREALEVGAPAVAADVVIAKGGEGGNKAKVFGEDGEELALELSGAAARIREIAEEEHELEVDLGEAGGDRFLGGRAAAGISQDNCGERLPSRLGGLHRRGGGERLAVAEELIAVEVAGQKTGRDRQLVVEGVGREAVALSELAFA